MVQAIENMTRLGGRIVQRQAHPTRPGYELVTLQVDRCDAVPGKADLLGRHLGSALPVAVSAALMAAAPASSATTSLRLVCRALMTPDGALAEAHPAPGDFSIEAA